jgi:hypothetical protein
MKRSQALWLGAAVGGLLGLSVGYLLSPPAEPPDPEQARSSFLSKAGPADIMAVAQIAWTLVRRLQRIRRREVPSY